MHIIIVGAGNIGSMVAAQLAGAHRVTLVARGARLAALQREGLRVRQGRREVRVVDLDVRDALTPDLPADLILVTVRADQMEPLLAPLAAHPAPRICFMFNSGDDDAAWQAQLGGRLVWAFPAALAITRGDVVEYSVVPRFLRFFQITTVGPAAHGSRRLAEEVAQVLDDAEIPTVLSDDMRAWLLGHLGFMLPLMAFAAGDGARAPWSLAPYRGVLAAQQEIFRAICAAGHPLAPANLRILARVPTWLSAPILWLVWRTSLQTVLLGHVAHARGEVATMVRTAKELAARAELAVPHVDALCGHSPQAPSS